MNAENLTWDGRPDAPCLGQHCSDIVGNTYSMNQLCESCADDYAAEPDTEVTQ